MESWYRYRLMRKDKPHADEIIGQASLLQTAAGNKIYDAFSTSHAQLRSSSEKDFFFLIHRLADFYKMNILLTSLFTNLFAP